MDPWLSPSGAFDASWFQLPKNQHLAALAQDKLRRPVSHKYVYISHEHQDHFDREFLDSLRARDFTLVVPRYRRPELRRILSDYRCKELVAINDSERVLLSDGYFCVYLDDSVLNRDSAILVKSAGTTFLNLNDCRIFDRVSQIVETEGAIDVLSSQFSGSSWHPTCYDYSDEEFKRISDFKTRNKYGAVESAIELCQPKIFIPAAGPPCFLDPKLLELNFRPANPFRRTPELAEYLRPVLERTGTKLPDAMPGDVFDATTGETVFMAPDRLRNDNYEDYIRSYAATYEGFFASREVLQNKTDLPKTWLGLRTELERKLKLLVLRERIPVCLYFGFFERPDVFLRVDFQNGVISECRGFSESSYFRIDAPAWQVADVLDGRMSWAEFVLGLRARLSREPDMYQPLIHSFITLDAGDLVHFCKMILELESREDRIEFSVCGKTISTLRWCPHNGADLQHATVEDERYLVCPRHKWRFDLSEGGACVTNDTSIFAYSLNDVSGTTNDVSAITSELLERPGNSGANKSVKQSGSAA